MNITQYEEAKKTISMLDELKELEEEVKRAINSIFLVKEKSQYSYESDKYVERKFQNPDFYVMLKMELSTLLETKIDIEKKRLTEKLESI